MLHIVRRSSVLALLAGAALALAGCGGDEQKTAFTGTQVVKHLERHAGVQLVQAPQAAGVEILSLPDGLKELHGGFEVYVVRSDKAKDQMEDYLNRTEPDDRGIYWLRDQNAGWIANTRYADNVVLAWFGAPRRGRVDDGWRSLDGALKKLE